MFQVADKAFVVKPGGFVHGPRGMVNHFNVVADQAKMLATYCPAGEEQAFIDAGIPPPEGR